MDKKSEIMMFGLYVNEYPDFSEKPIWEKSKKEKAFDQLYDKIGQEVKSQMELEQNVPHFFGRKLHWEYD